MNQTNDRVNHPSYYGFPNGVEAIDIARYLSFNLGNAVKYVARAGKKQEEGIGRSEKQIEDLKKAIFYIEDEIKRLKEYETIIAGRKETH